MISPDNHERLMVEDINYKINYLERQLEINELYYKIAFTLLCDEMGELSEEDVSAMINKLVFAELQEKGNILLG